ncbi:MAG: HAD-IIB family hydrolase [Pirellulales bacterium]|nr:HAD-IIB family hydrolase [Pirellulales bacterium]
MDGVRLVVSDLDGTLLGDDKALARWARWLAPRRESIRLAYNSGRFFASVAEVIETTPLPRPDAVIGGVGTEIRRYPDGAAVADGWPGRRDGWDPAAIRRALAADSALELQPEEFQAPFKLSYYARDLDAAALTALQERLARAGQRVEIVYSSSRDLDFLPAGVNKGSAAAALAAAWRLAPWQVFVAGDTGNDASMFAQGFRGIVVANARDELRRLTAPTIYHAKASFAAGVLEGLCHWLGKDLGIRGHQSSASCAGGSTWR